MQSTVARSGWFWLLLIVGLIVCTPATTMAGFVFTTIDVPGATFTDAAGINNAGQIVGTFSDATGTHGFLNTGGVFATINVPGAFVTQAFGINDAGQVVGFFGDATGTHGFLALPAAVPGAGTLVLVASGLLALGAARVRSRPRRGR
jgi:probable HAF family extracellular repeat protein